MFSLWEEESFTLFQRVCFPHVSTKSACILYNYACRATGQQGAYITGCHSGSKQVLRAQVTLKQLPVLKVAGIGIGHGHDHHEASCIHYFRTDLIATHQYPWVLQPWCYVHRLVRLWHCYKVKVMQRSMFCTPDAIEL